MSSPPYMKLWIADYHADTTHLSVEEHGAYLLLIMAMWRAGGRLPADDAKLSKLAKCSSAQWAEIRDVVLAFFKRTGGRLTHRRIIKEMAKYEATSEKRKEASERGVSEKRRKNNKLAQPIGSEIGNQLVAKPEPEPEGSIEAPKRASNTTRREGATEPPERSVGLSLVPIDDEREWALLHKRAEDELFQCRRTDPDHASELAGFIVHAEAQVRFHRKARLAAARAA